MVTENFAFTTKFIIFAPKFCMKQDYFKEYDRENQSIDGRN